MLNDIQKSDLLDKYLLDTLSTSEQQQFDELLKRDTAFAEDVSFHKDFMVGMDAVGDEQLKGLFQTIEQELAAQNAKTVLIDKAKQLATDIQGKVNYTADQLIALFRPVPSYEMIMNYTNRGEDLEVITPAKNYDCKDQVLHFEMKAPGSNEMTILIENNAQEKVQEVKVAEQEMFFTIKLSDDLKPGIYYWKVSDGKNMVMGDFYLGKNLLPKV